ncbi:MAG: hypothetical protein R3A10_11580 [Caldilineaceae bacterium]
MQSSIDDLHRMAGHPTTGKAPVLAHRPLVGGAMLAAAYVEQHPERVAQAVLAEQNAGQRRAGPFQEHQAAARSLRYYRRLVPTIFESFRVDGPDDGAQMDYIWHHVGRLCQHGRDRVSLCRRRHRPVA